MKNREMWARPIKPENNIKCKKGRQPFVGKAIKSLQEYRLFNY